jgi:hypothetical protein
MRATVLYMEGCRSTLPTVPLIRDVAAELGVSIVLERVRVETPDHATGTRFLGSPTVQVGGHDIDLEAWNALDFGLT